MKRTIKDIAKEAGVSITTVSQILNHKGGRFSQETRDRVLKIADAHHYQADYFAKAMVTRRSKTIGMIVPDVTDLFFSRLIEGVESYLNSLGYMIILCNSKHQSKLEEHYFLELIGRAVEGIIIATPNKLSPVIFEHPLVVQKKIPFILVDMGINSRTEGNLLITEYEGVYQAIHYLLELGHRKIAFLKEKKVYYSLKQRYQAYQACLIENHIDPLEKMVVECELTVQGGYQGMGQLLNQTQGDLTAVFCSNDQMAIGAYQAIYEAGLKIPQDISIIGFDGIELGRYLAPSLTTVAQPIYEIGEMAGRLTLDAIMHPLQRIPNRQFATELVIGDSVQKIDPGC